MNLKLDEIIEDIVNSNSFIETDCRPDKFTMTLGAEMIGIIPVKKDGIIKLNYSIVSDS